MANGSPKICHFGKRAVAEFEKYSLILERNRQRWLDGIKRAVVDFLSDATFAENACKEPTYKNFTGVFSSFGTLEINDIDEYKTKELVYLKCLLKYTDEVDVQSKVETLYKQIHPLFLPIGKLLFKIQSKGQKSGDVDKETISKLAIDMANAYIHQYVSYNWMFDKTFKGAAYAQSSLDRIWDPACKADVFDESCLFRRNILEWLGLSDLFDNEENDSDKKQMLQKYAELYFDTYLDFQSTTKSQEGDEAKSPSETMRESLMKLTEMLSIRSTSYNSHQDNVGEYVQKNLPAYGILYHEMGSGKTCTAVRIIKELVNMDHVDNVFVLVPSQFLVSQFEADFKYVCSFIYPELWDKKQGDATLVSFEYNGTTITIMSYDRYARYLDKIPSNSVLFIDEAHNFRNCYDYTQLMSYPSNDDAMSDDAVCLLDPIDNTKQTSCRPMSVKKCKFNAIISKNDKFMHVFLMTGTPIINNFTDIITVISALSFMTCQSNVWKTEPVRDAINALKAIKKSPETLNNVIELVFTHLKTILNATNGFVSRVRVADNLKKLILPSVDMSKHYCDYSHEFKEVGANMDADKKYKAGITANPVTIEMDQKAYDEMMKGRHSTSGVKTSKISWSSAKEMYNAQVVCNASKMETILGHVVQHLRSDTKSPVLIHTTIMETVKALHDRFIATGSFVHHPKSSLPLVVEVGEKRKRNSNNNASATQKNTSINAMNVNVLAAAEQDDDDACNVSNAKHPNATYNGNTGNKYVFAIIHGGSTNVAEIMKEYNDIRNIKGDMIAVCIITQAAGTGFTFRNTRQLHIVEPYWSFPYLQQVTGRVVRHNVFSPYITDNNMKEPHVKVFAYIATTPPKSDGTKTKTIDEEKLDLMREKMVDVELASEVLYRVSIENRERQQTRNPQVNGKDNKQQVLDRVNRCHNDITVQLIASKKKQVKVKEEENVQEEGQTEKPGVFEEVPLIKIKNQGPIPNPTSPKHVNAQGTNEKESHQRQERLKKIIEKYGTSPIVTRSRMSNPV